MISPEYVLPLSIAIISIVLLVAATWLGVQNYLLTRSISNYWLIFSFLTTSFTSVWLLIVLQLFGVFPGIIEQIRDSLIMAWVALLFVLALEILSSHEDVPIK